MKKIRVLIISGVCLISMLTGCNTVQGIGKDVSKGGQEIERAAS